MKIVVVHGPPCSGKTTFVQENISNSDIVFDYDRILRAISAKQNHRTEKGGEKWNESRIKSRWSAYFRICKCSG